MHPKAMARILSVLATEKRLHIMQVLIEANAPVPSGVIGAIIGTESGPTSFNLTKLSEVGLVLKHASGRFVFYSANRVVMEEISNFWKGKENEQRRNAREVEESGG